MENKLFDDVTRLLKENNLTYKWLICILKSKGMNDSTVSLSKWAHGVQIAQTAEEVHAMSLKIINLYVKSFAKKVEGL